MVATLFYGDMSYFNSYLSLIWCSIIHPEYCSSYVLETYVLYDLRLVHKNFSKAILEILVSRLVSFKKLVLFCENQPVVSLKSQILFLF